MVMPAMLLPTVTRFDTGRAHVIDPLTTLPMLTLRILSRRGMGVMPKSPRYRTRRPVARQRDSQGGAAEVDEFAGAQRCKAGGAAAASDASDPATTACHDAKQGTIPTAKDADSTS